MDSTCLADRDTVIVKDDPFSGRPPRLLTDRLIPISELVERAEIDPADVDLVRVFMNGEEVGRPLWPFVIARGHVEIAVVPQGGDGDKVLRTLLTIAVVVAAFYVGGVAASAFGLEAGTAAYSAVSAGVAGITSTVGQLAINAILPPPKLSGNYAADPDPVYFINGARNQLALNQPIHTVLGRHRVFPRLLSRPYPEIRGEDSYYYVVLDYGPLGVEVSDRKVGDTPISELDGVEYQERLTANDPHPTMASRQVIADPVGATLGAGDWEGRRTASDTVDCDLILLFPQGLGKVNDKGKPRSHSTSIKVRYREVIDPGPGETFGPWQFASQALPGRIPFRNFDDQFVGLESYEGGQLGNFTFTATKPGEPFYRQIGFSFPSAGTWDVQVQRVGADGEITDKIYDDMRLEQILSKRDEPAVQNDDVAYGVFRLKATDETNGAVDTLNMVLGRLIPSFPDAVLDQSDLTGVTSANLSELKVSSNPWEQTAWIARNGFYARRPYADSEIDWPSLAAAAKDARDRGKRFDYVVTADISSEDLMAMAGFAGEGRPYRFNNVFKAHVDRPQPAPTHYFREGTARNISVTVSWPQEVHAYRVTFNDADDGWRQREVVVYVDGYTKETAARIEPFSIAGKTHWDDLHESLQQHYRNSRAQKELMRCEVPADMVDNTLEPMAWVSVATRVLAQARESGVIREVYTNGSGQVTGLKLDQPIAQGPSQAALSLKWVRQDDDSPAIFSPAAFLLDVPASDTVSPEIVFDTPLTGASAPQVGDEWVVGPSGVELFEGLLDKAEDVSEGWLRLYLKSYAVARFDDTGFSVPDYAPGYDLPVTPVPPRPVFELSTADERRIIVRFSFPDGFAAQISHFRVWRADAPPADDDNPGVYSVWESLPDLPGTARAVIDGARNAGDRVVYRIQAVAQDGTVGPILETGVINAADDIGQPQNVTVTPGTETGPQGASKPVFSVSFTPDPRLALLDAVIAIRQVVFSEGVRVPEGSQPAFEQGFIVDPASGKGVVRGITAGSTYDLRVYFRGRRGEIGDPVTVLDVVATSSDTSLGAISAVDGGPLADALALLDDARAAVDARLSSAEATIDAAEAVINENVTGLEAVGTRVTQVENTQDDQAILISAAQAKADEGDTKAAQALLATSDNATAITAVDAKADDAQSSATQALNASQDNANAITQVETTANQASSNATLALQTANSASATAASVDAIARAGDTNTNLVPNGYFNLWENGNLVPDGYSVWGGAGAFTRNASTQFGRYALKVSANAGGQNGATVIVPFLFTGKFLLRVRAALNGGSWEGAQVYGTYRTSSGASNGSFALKLWSEADTAGSAGAGVGGYRYWEYEIEAPSGTLDLLLYVAAHSNANGGNIASQNEIIFQMVELTPLSKAASDAKLALSATQTNATAILSTQTTANNAQSTANSASSAASNAQSTANSASSTASIALSTAQGVDGNLNATLQLRGVSGTSRFAFSGYAAAGSPSVIELDANYINMTGNVLIDGTLTVGKIAQGAITQAGVSTGGALTVGTGWTNAGSAATCNVPANSSLVRIDFKVQGQGGASALEGRVLRNGADITGPIVLKAVQSITDLTVYQNGTATLDYTVKSNPLNSGTFTDFFPDVGAPTGNNTYQLQVRAPNGGWYLNSSTIFATCYAR